MTAARLRSAKGSLSFFTQSSHMLTMKVSTTPIRMRRLCSTKIG